ncbi:MAG TPA: UPF0223 family protein [Bacillaceae bacterium]
MEYQYPFSHHWSTEEVIDAVAFFQAVEAAYEKGIYREEFMDAYRKFKKVVPGKAEEKKYGKEFEEASGYSSYQAVEAAKKAGAGERISLKELHLKR